MKRRIDVARERYRMHARKFCYETCKAIVKVVFDVRKCTSVHHIIELINGQEIAKAIKVHVDGNTLHVSE